jgi:Zn-dependent protease
VQAQQPYAATSTPSNEEVVRQMAQSAMKMAQQAMGQQQRQQDPYAYADEETRKKLIEQRLKKSKGLLSFGSELVDILIGFTLIVLVFGFSRLIFFNDWWGFLISAILITTAFLPHEMAHKVVAQRRGQYARYILWTRGIIYTLFTLIFRIGLIVPGFVAIVPLSRQMDKKDLGMVALAGPAINAVIGAISLVIGLLTDASFGIIPFIGLFATPNIFIQVAQFNALIALFNCLPVWQLDGAKILKWDWKVFAIVVVINVAIVIPSFILNPGFF